MMPNDERYDRVARFLDGEDLALGEADRALADEIGRDEAELGALLGASVPAGAIEKAWQGALLADVERDEAALAPLLDVELPALVAERVRQRLRRHLARPQRRLIFVGAGAALAAAAAVLLAVAVLWQPPPSGRPTGRLAGRPVGSAVARAIGRPATASRAAPAVPAEVIAASVQVSEDPAFVLLARDIERFEAEVASAAPVSAVDAGIQQLQQDLETFWIDEPMQ